MAGPVSWDVPLCHGRRRAVIHDFPDGTKSWLAGLRRPWHGGRGRRLGPRHGGRGRRLGPRRGGRGRRLGPRRGGRGLRRPAHGRGLRRPW